MAISHNFVKFDALKKLLICQGEWTLDYLPQLQQEIDSIFFPTSGEITISDSNIIKMDIAGAWVLVKKIKQLSRKGLKINYDGFSEQHKELLSIIDKELTEETKPLPIIKYPNWLAALGQRAIELLDEIRKYLAFIGELTFESLRILGQPRRFRFREVCGIIYKAGYEALPIIALLSFMVGMVIAHQTGIQLKKYGANIFIVDLIGFSILREFGPLITAIMVTGRTGSAFTAQLGTMKINQEIDALNTMSVTPAELLLIPRIIALTITLPLLTIWADIFGVIGGMLTTNNILNISAQEFLHRFHHEVPIKALIIGLGKAPVFALIIASIGCFQGMQVEKSADNVGRLTTRSVVLAIFFIVVADAFFSILTSAFKL